MVLEAQSPTIKSLWDALLPAQNAEQPFLFQWSAKAGYQGTSFKDIYAQAQCVAGYLMQRGLRQGDAIGILGKPNLRYHVFHIALQYLGIVNVTFPPEATTQDVEQLAFKYDFRMLYVDTVAQFQAHGEFRDLKAGLSLVIIGEDEVDDLDPDKIVTFDRVVTLGKVPWREQVAEMKAMKAAVVPQSLYAVLVDADGRATELKMEKWLWAVDAAEKVLTTANAQAMLSTITPDRLLWRAFSFAAARARCGLYLREGHDFKGAGLAAFRPDVILSDHHGALALHHTLPELIDSAEKGRKAIQAALEIVRKRDLAQSEGKPDRFMNRMRYRFSNRKLYKRIRLKLGGRLQHFHVDTGPVDADARLLLAECGISMNDV